MSFNWIVEVEDDINDVEHNGEECYIEINENTNEINQNDLNDQDSNYDSIPHNVPHSHKKTYTNTLNNLQEIDQDEFINKNE